jgi:hypothetical protein
MSQSPLFDIYSDDIDPIGIVPLRKRRTLADLMPEEEKGSLLRELANQGSSGLSAFGYALDTPGALVRGILAGDPLSVFGTSDERVTGRELLRQYGLVGSEDNWGNFAGGLGAEILLDPLTYASFGLTALLGTGAKTAAAKAATRAGLMGTAGDDLVLRAARAAETGALPNTGPATFLRNATPSYLADDLAEQAATRAGRDIDDVAVRTLAEDAARQQSLLDAQRAFEQVGGTAEQWTQPLARSNYLKVPYLVDDAFDMYGSTVGDYLARGSDWLQTNARATPVIGPVLRGAQALFDSRVKGFDDEAGQMFGRRVTSAEQTAMRDVNRRLAQMHVQLMQDVGRYAETNPNAFAGTTLAGLSGEEIVRSQEFARAFGDVMEKQFRQLPPEMRGLFRDPNIRQAVRFAIDEQRDALARAERLGIPLKHKELPNFIRYFTRQATDIPAATYDPRFQGTKAIPLRDRAVASINDGTRSSRRGYTEAFPRWVLNKMYQDADLQAALRNAPNTEARLILDDWLTANASEFQPIRNGGMPFDYMAKGLDPKDLSDEAMERAAEVARRQQQAYEDLADSLRRTPLQRANEGIPLYGNSLNDLSSYVRHSARREATADVLLDELSSNALLQAADDVPGGAVYTPLEALRELGFMATKEDDAGVLALARRMGVSPEELLGKRSFSRDLVDRLNTNLTSARAPREAQGLFKAIDAYTQQFKSLALLWPARYVRDMYSGAFAGATQGGFNPFDAAAAVGVRGGNYGPLAKQLERAPGYQIDDLFPVGPAPSAEQLAEARVRKFLTEAAGEGLTFGSVSDDLGRQASNLTYNETFPGGAGPIFQGMGERIRRRPIPYDLLWSLRNSEGNKNWLLELGDRAAEGSDAFNRIGTYLTRVRKGDAPAAAKAVADLTQVNYRPEAFTAFERDILKRIIPFYSYTKGISPLVAQELINNPSGIMGQSIRGINRLSEPSEDRFTPEYLRQSAAIPIDPAFPLLGVNTPGITRVLTNIDLPHEGLLNLLTPGVGNTLTGQAIDMLTKTGQNLLGQTNPLFKAPLEFFTNRQFYSGRQLSDLYSLAEQLDLPGGRLWDQVMFNFPGGSRVFGAGRQLFDTRISPQERAAKFLVNTLTGVKVQDVDQERTARLAARTTLNQLLDQAKGMSSYENLFIKPEDLVKLSPQEQRQYLLYRVLQSEAAKKARERKKMENDPLAILGVQNA